MNLKQKTEAIQLAVGAGVDGDYGNETADKIMAKLNISTALTPVNSASMVQGNATGIKRIFIHCSATPEGRHVTRETIKGWHLANGWKDIGYHYIIYLDGTIVRGRNENVTGSHVAGWNTGSIAICYVGGLTADAKKSKDTRTDAQKAAMAGLVKDLVKAYPGVDVLGHRDASPDKNKDGKITPNEWLKDCPCFDVREWWKGVK